VVARDNSSVEARGNSSVVARDNSSVEARDNSSVEARDNSSVEARDNSSVVAGENSSVVARDNSSVKAWENSSVEARGNSSVVARDNSSVKAWENSSVVARDNSSVEARGKSSVVARGNSSVEARGNSSVEAWDNSSVVAWGNVGVHAFSSTSTVLLYAFAVAWLVDKAAKVVKKSRTATVITPKPSAKSGPSGWFEEEALVPADKRVVVFKRVSKDFQTQEGTPNETKWNPGTEVKHPNWDPKNGERGEGKFHACSRTYFCDEFRNKRDDRYVALEVAVKDIYVWPGKRTYQHKVAFRAAKVLYEVNRLGKKIS
jgi:hypothetical protein